MERVKAESVSKEELDQYEEVLDFFGWLKPNEQEMLEGVLLKEMSPEEVGKQFGLSKRE